MILSGQVHDVLIDEVVQGWQVAEEAPPAGVLEDPEGELVAGGVLQTGHLGGQGGGGGHPSLGSCGAPAGGW